jgi:hypothetical protein
MHHDQLTHRVSDTVLHVEMFLHNYPGLLGLKYFANLSSLSIVQQPLDTLTGVQNCVNLKVLRVVECQVLFEALFRFG